DLHRTPSTRAIHSRRSEFRCSVPVRERGVAMIEGYPEIARDVSSLKQAPNLADWAAIRESFSWEDAWAELDTPDGLINKAHECVDRHANGANADTTAIIWQAADDHVETFTYAEFSKQTNKVANALKALGIEKGERV